MREIIRKKLAGLRSADEKYNFLREFLQELVLQIIDRRRYTRNVAFVGGTALRMLYDLPRFSEDLDFSLVLRKGFDFIKMLKVVQADLSLAGFEVEMSRSKTRTVLSAFVKFKSILHELGLSSHPGEKIFIKLEIDSDPPKGYRTEISLINKNVLFKVCNYDLPSLFAAKLHAFLFRKYAKGRDFYDLLWLLTRKTPINYKLLNAAAKQTEGKAFKLDAARVKDLLLRKIRKTDFRRIKKDIEPFLVNYQEIEYFQAEYFLSAIEKEF